MIRGLMYLRGKESETWRGRYFNGEDRIIKGTCVCVCVSEEEGDEEEHVDSEARL